MLELRDETAQRERERALEQLALRYALSDVANRLLILEQLQRMPPELSCQRNGRTRVEST